MAYTRKELLDSNEKIEKEDVPDYIVAKLSENPELSFIFKEQVVEAFNRFVALEETAPKDNEQTTSTSPGY